MAGSLCVHNAVQETINVFHHMGTFLDVLWWYTKYRYLIWRSVHLCDKVSMVQGVRVHQKMRQSVCIISLATNMLEGWDIIHLKSDIHSSVWSTTPFCTISGSRDMSKSKWGIRFLKKNRRYWTSRVLKSDVPYFFTYISAPLRFTEMSLNMKNA